jgi:glutamyl-tRNA(Gln) amidotransferase subunit E
MTYPFKSFQEMTSDDYQQLGLKVGLEIHQQLYTHKKLFCRCPAGLYNHKYDAEILRHMRPTLSELGEYDGTALMEFKTKKEIIYQINHESVCTYEMDDTPPFVIDEQSLDISLEIAMLLNYKLVNEIHIARKQYLDGSIPTGFQRTTIVGVDGWIPFKDRQIGLIQLGLEEDSCREVSDEGHLRIYRTDRLGMPLIEMVTKAEMYTPEEVAEVANILRWTVRSTGKVRTGIGAARQDVNVSIKGGTRVEIKGVSRIPLLPRLIYNEVRRQHSLLEIRDELKNRGITLETFQAKSKDVTHLLSRTSWEPLRQALDRQEKIHCVNLKGYAGILSKRTQTDKVFSKEISDRVRVIACLTRLPNILTSESSEETIDSYTWQKIRKMLGAQEKDAQILVWGNAIDVKTGINEIIIRAREAISGVPNETRQALEDGTNGFERILPGPDRMYPDTDLPPLEISDSRCTRIEKLVPEPFWKRLKKYEDWNIPQHLLIAIASSNRAEFFENLCGKYQEIRVQIARYLFEKMKYWHRQKLPVHRLTNDFWKNFFKAIDKYPIALEAGDQIIAQYLTTKKPHVTDITKAVESYASKNSKLHSDLGSVLQPDLTGDIPTFSDSIKAHHYHMGQLMEKYRGIIPGEKLANLLEKMLQEEQIGR